MASGIIHGSVQIAQQIALYPFGCYSANQHEPLFGAPVRAWTRTIVMRAHLLPNDGGQALRDQGVRFANRTLPRSRLH